MKAKQKIFISYSHKDKECYVDFCTHLDTLKVEFWSDVEILAGGSLDEIFSKLEDSTIFVALVSPDYLYSESCKKELERAFQLKSEGRIIIIPVIIRDCNWEQRFDGILAIPEDGKAITNWDNKDKAFTDAIKKINKRVEYMNSKQKEYIDENKIKKNGIEFYQTYNKTESSLQENLGHPIAETKKISETERDFDKNFAIFLAGPDLKNKKTCEKAKLRYKILKALQADDYKVFDGEGKKLRLIQKQTGDNVQQSELKFIKDECQAVVIIPGSPGSFCEFGLFSWHYIYGDLLKKPLTFIALVDERYEDEKSYFNEGPVRSIERYEQGKPRVIWVNYNKKNHKEYIKEVKRILSSARTRFRKKG